MRLSAIPIIIITANDASIVACLSGIVMMAATEIAAKNKNSIFKSQIPQCPFCTTLPGLRIFFPNSYYLLFRLIFLENSIPQTLLAIFFGRFPKFGMYLHN